MDFRFFTPNRILFWIANDSIICGTLKQYALEYFPNYNLPGDLELLHYEMFCTNHTCPVPELTISELLQVQYDIEEQTAKKMAILFEKLSLIA